MLCGSSKGTFEIPYKIIYSYTKRYDFYTKLKTKNFSDMIAYVRHYNDVIMTTMASKITSLTIVYSIIYSDADQRKHQSSASPAFLWGIHRSPVNSLHKVPVTRKMFPFDDVNMFSHAARSYLSRHRNSFEDRVLIGFIYLCVCVVAGGWWWRVGGWVGVGGYSGVFIQHSKLDNTSMEYGSTKYLMYSNRLGNDTVLNVFIPGGK